MKGFFRELEHAKLGRASLPSEAVARQYAKYMWPHVVNLGGGYEKIPRRSRYHVSLSTDNRELAFIAKRASLVSDTLLLSHRGSSRYVPIGHYTDLSMQIPTSYEVPVEYFGIHCPDLPALGEWIRDSKEMLEAGLWWYLPIYSYATRMEPPEVDTFTRRRRPAPYAAMDGLYRPERVEERRGQAARSGHHLAGSVAQPPVNPIDYIVRDKRIIDASGATPEKGELIRPVARIDLPFIDGVTLRDFSEITVNEFSSYEGFRGFLRDQFDGMGRELESNQSEKGLAKIEREIQDQILSVNAQLKSPKRQRILAATHGSIGLTVATLTAVNGSLMNAALAGLVTSTSLWPVLNQFADSSKQPIRDGRWYYVWTLDQKYRNQ
ncbi:hypothetical protein KY5_8128c [Streptomyces formicae]|uniref:Uncharacterized protein n=2 Tax=Streptomyces formicae TaxID=1616117 RepID=A0A291QNK3_9ACTN|nr:hypothetical protein KY5_8128c [Streptomyces formicae]